MADKTVLWSHTAQAQIANTDRETALGILQALDDYLTTGIDDVKRLRPPRRESRLRVGDYRVFFCLRDLRCVEILAIKHRRDAYG